MQAIFLTDLKKCFLQKPYFNIYSCNSKGPMASSGPDVGCFWGDRGSGELRSTDHDNGFLIVLLGVFISRHLTMCVQTE